MAANVQLSFGPMLIGVFINMILYGILIVQTYSYYQTYRNDSLWMRLFVAYLFIMETINTAFDMEMMYEPLIAKFGTEDATKFFPTLFMTEPIIIVMISTPIQFFFAWRIKKITKSIWIPLIISVMALASLGGGMWTGVKIAIVKLFAKKPEMHWSALMWFAASCIADILITGALVRSLSQRKTGFAATDGVIDRIIRMTVQTGAVTAVCAIGDVAFFMALPHTALNFLWDLSLSKLYTNCLMSTLNARQGLNNMTGAANSGQQRNIHFTDGGIVSTSGRRHNETYLESGHAHSAMYELETQKSSDFDPSYPPRGDVEYGITVTKVVETLQDPLPHPMRETTQ